MKSSFMLVALTTLSACAGPQAVAPNRPLCSPSEESRPLPVTHGTSATVTSGAGGPVTQVVEQKVKVPPPPECEQKVAAPAPKPAAPVAPAAAATFDPPAGEYAGPQTIALSSTTPGAVIHYTTDGSPPTADSPTYANPIPVDKNTSVQAIVVAPGAPNSAISTAAYTIAPPPPPPPPSRVAVAKERLELKEVVLFETGKATIDQRSHSLLDEVAAALKDHSEVKSVRIEGHTDNTGKAAANSKLSQARAEAVREYLVAHGVASDRLTAKGYGQSQPVASNKTAAGRAANRRVDFIIPQE